MNYWSRYLRLAVLAMVAITSFAMGQQRKAQPPKSVRLYVFDCGKLDIPDTSPYQLKKEELATTMIADFIGGKAMYRAAKVVPYGLASIGFGYLTSSTSYYGSSSFAVRYGGGVDIPIGDTMAWKFELSRMSFHFGQLTATGGSWTTGTNFQTGIVFTLSQ